MNYLKNILLLIASPLNGWAEIKKYNVPKNLMLANVFYPILGLIALSTFVSYLYSDTSGIPYFLENVIANVGRYFFGYLISAYVLSGIFCKNENANEINKVHIFVIYNYIILAIISICENLLPVSIPLLELMPLLLIYIIWRGYNYFKTDMPETKFVVIFTLGIILPMVLLKIMFKLLLNIN